MSSDRELLVWLVGFHDGLHGDLADAVRGAGGRALFLTGPPEGSASPAPRCVFLDADGLGPDTEAVVQALVADGIPAGVVATEPSPEQARAMGRAGAEDFRAKPLTAEVVHALVRRDPAAGESGFITESPAMRQLLKKVKKLAGSDGAGLLCGASGTGKERLAAFIHEHSPRRDGPLVAVNCASLPEGLLESELFGHEKGAFTGADQRREGRFQQAQDGTLLLDEITEMPVDLQAKLLRVLQEGVVDRVGGHRPESVNVRVLATTNRDPETAVAEGQLRADLLYRLSVVRVRLPDLAQRAEDIPVLAEHFVRLYVQRYGRPIEGLDQAARDYLQNRSWPGNVRELENAIHRAVVLSDKRRLSVGDLTEDELSIESVSAPSGQFGGDSVAPVGSSSEERLPEADLTIQEMEDLLIARTLERVGGNRTRAAELLGISIRTLRNKLNRPREREA
ncbi:sigma-54 dependent transcriptional regulator [Thiohalorhabdus sp.]|uniref:sigma-54 dependent transcriptional regulator n=1 Tax=Thiohalorhabdus sp. TaxID=3094134 RepID=UPI002FC2E2D9